MRSLVPALALAVLSVLAITRGQGVPSGVADGWTKSPRPIIGATQPWERGVVEEPTVLHHDGVYQMWYEGGWDRGGIGYATSRDGVHWRKRERILGGGAENNSVLLYRGMYYLFFARQRRPGLFLATSRDGWHFTVRARPILRPAGWAHILANTVIWVEHGRWQMIYEARVSATGPWEMGRAVGRGPTRWTPVGGPLTALALTRGGTYGGPALVRQGGSYLLLYHATRVPGVLPTDIYAATSSDLRHWHRLHGPFLARTRPWEVDQTADPWLVRVGDRCLLYYDGMNNRAPAGAIGLATRRLTSPNQSCLPTR